MAFSFLPNRSTRFTAMMLLFIVLPLWAQQSAKPPAKTAVNKEEVPATTRTSEAPEVLQQLNSALEGLVAKVSPAVVQILVSGLGPVENGNRNDTAKIGRQHALGSGVIVDPNGYIMTNAHVIEG